MKIEVGKYYYYALYADRVVRGKIIEQIGNNNYIIKLNGYPKRRVYKSQLLAEAPEPWWNNFFSKLFGGSPL